MPNDFFCVGLVFIPLRVSWFPSAMWNCNFLTDSARNRTQWHHIDRLWEIFLHIPRKENAGSQCRWKLADSMRKLIWHQVESRVIFQTARNIFSLLSICSVKLPFCWKSKIVKVKIGIIFQTAKIIRTFSSSSIQTAILYLTSGWNWHYFSDSTKHFFAPLNLQCEIAIFWNRKIVKVEMDIIF
jgi:hypothetical protein